MRRPALEAADGEGKAKDKAKINGHVDGNDRDSRPN
jgi:hypothetical protein